MPQISAALPIACVEGWSASGTWGGVRVRDLMGLVDAPTGFSGPRRVAAATRGLQREPPAGQRGCRSLTILALTLAGEPLCLDHGYPCRIIAPNRPGALQTKWVNRFEVQP